MVSIELLALDRITWQLVADDPVLFACRRALTLGAEVDLFRSVGRQTVAMLQRTSSIAPWTGYLAIDRLHGVIVGTCAFTASPDAEGVVEIAYLRFHFLRAVAMRARWRRGLSKWRKAPRKFSECARTRYLSQTSRRGFWRRPGLNERARQSIRKGDRYGVGNARRDINLLG